MKFAQPTWFYALIALLPLVGLRVWAHLSNRRNLSGLVSARLYDQLVYKTSSLQTWLSFSFILCGLALFISALARPQWGFETLESYSEGRSLIIAVDTSRSMLATDLSPNRLERAKLAARDLIESMSEDRIGLIAFAGKAFLQAPLTNDHEAIIEALSQVDTELIPRGGTNLAETVGVALEAFREANSKHNALVIFSDGEAHEGLEEIARIKEAAARENLVIITLGVGTEAGSIIPEPGPDGRPVEGSFIRDENGQVVRSRLDSTALRGLATRGNYFQLGDRASLREFVQAVTSRLSATREKTADIKLKPIERFMWPLGAGLACLVLSHLIPLLVPATSRRGAVAVPPPARVQGKRNKTALTMIILWFNAAALSQAESTGWDLMKREEFESAVKSFETEVKAQNLSEREKAGLYLGLGNAAYRLGNLEKATEAYGQALVVPSARTREQAHYNLGNTLFRKGEVILSPPKASQETVVPMSPDPARIDATLRQWVGSLEHFEAALRVNPRNADARHNADLVKKKIDELKSQKQKSQQDKDQQDKDQQDKDQQDKDQQDKDQQDKDQQDKDQQDKDQQDKDQQDKDQQDKDQQDKDQQDKDQQDKDQQDKDQQGKDQQGKDQQDKDQQGKDQQGNDQQGNDQQGNDQQGNDQQDKDQPGNSGKPKNAQNQPGQDEPPMPPEPSDGQLSSEDDRNRPPGRQSNASDHQPNPQTGYSPSQARQLIESLSEERDLRPIIPGNWRPERYKNW